MTGIAELPGLLEAQRSAFLAEGVVSAETRIDRLSRAIALLHDHQSRIGEAIHADFGARSAHQTRMSDVYATMEALKHARDHVRTWMKPEKRKTGFPLNLLGAKARVEHVPKGVVGILGTWNFPVNTLFAPLAGVLAAGNRAILKPSELVPRTGALLDELVRKAFDPKELVCVQGGPELGAAVAGLPLDHVVFTGSTSIGKKVMRAAAENLVPVTLELGGKSPAFVAPDADLREAAIRILTGKALNVGQACLAPDYVFVPEDRLERFLVEATAWVATMFPRILDNPDYSSVIDERHYRRLRGYLDEARAAGTEVRQVDPAREDFERQSGTHKIPMTFVVDPKEGLRILEEEIFGPILIVKPYRDLGDAIRYVRSRPRPLGLYVFSGDEATKRRILDETISGGVSINDVLVHASMEDLPFGGVGPSGIGCYHGQDGFRAFSHARAVYEQTKLPLQRLAGMVPPYGERADQTLDRIVRK